MELSNATRLGVGRTAEVYAWGEGRVLKLFHPWHPEEWAASEHRLTAAASEAGLPAPRVYGLERVERRLGIVLERIEGPSLLRLLSARPWTMLAVARRLAEVHAAIHAHRVPGLAPLTEHLRWRIDRAGIEEPLRAGVAAALARMPAGEAACHGDLHPDNVVLTRRGPVVIDWPELSAGHPLADVARTSLMLRISSPPQGQLRRVLQAGRRLLHAVYLRTYLARAGARAEDLAPFLLPVAAARLGYALDDERCALRGILERLAGERGVDDLAPATQR
ncbi:MAG TPA: phosphotransferase [Anaeromyxobacter sp.]|nr:phosphotransferase [Anaeromyxobacter sp.]